MRAERVGSRHAARADRAHGRRRRSAPRAPMQRLADLVAAYFVPAVVAIAVAHRRSPGGSSVPSRGSAYALVNAVAVLIIACPCALGLATPMSIMVAMGQGAMTASCSATPRRSRSCARSTRWSSTRPARSPSAGPSCVDVVAAGHRRGRGAAARREPRAGKRASARAGHRRGAPRAAGSRSQPVEEFRVDHRAGRRGTVDGRQVALGNARADGAIRRRARRRSPAQPRRCATQGKTRDVRRRRRPPRRR